MTEPVNVRILPRKISVSEFAGAMLITVVPVAVVIIMQRPDLREMLLMKFWKLTENIGWAIETRGAHVAQKSIREYSKVTL